MRKITLLALGVVWCFAASAFADDIVFDLSPATGVASYQESFGTGQGVSVQTTQTISDMEFWMAMPNGGDLKFMIWAGDLNNLLFLTTVSDVTPFYIPKWVSSGPMNFTLQAGQIYWFAIISDVTVYVGYIFPEIDYSNHGLTALTAPGNPFTTTTTIPISAGITAVPARLLCASPRCQNRAASC